MEFLINAVYIYIAIFSVYFLMLSLRNLRTKKSRIDNIVKYNIEKKQLCVVLYTHNQFRELSRMLSQLRSQDYTINNFHTYVILDNCSDESEKFLNLKPSVNVLNLNEGGLIGKDSSYSILLEKLIPNKDIDAYVFLDVDKYISNTFLTDINYALSKKDVITGSVVYQGHKLNFVNKIKKSYFKYRSNFLQNARSLFGLSCQINSQLLIIKKSLVDAIGSIDFETTEGELKYSLLLSKIKYQCYFNPYIKCYSMAKKVDLKIPSLSRRLKLFKNCFSSTRTTNLSYIEFVYSLLNPNNLFLIFAYTVVILFSLKYYFFVSSDIVVTTCLFLVTGFFLSLINADLRGKEYFYLMLYPIYSFFKLLLGLPLIKQVVNFIVTRSDNDVQKYVVNVEATIRNKKLPCKIELIVKDDMSKVVFRYKKKKFSTSSHLRMNDALKELIDKLRDYNFTLNICQCCQYFKPLDDGTQNMVQGTCHYKFADMQPDQQFTVLLWNSCPAFKLSMNHSIIEEIANN